MEEMKTEDSNGLSRRTMARDLILATRFLSTLSRAPNIKALLERGAGYAEKDHQEGWDLLHAVMGYRTDAAPKPVSLPQDRALEELDAWDGPAFDRTRAAWRYAFADQLEYVFDGLNAQTGSGAMRSVRTFVDRVVALRDGTDPRRAKSRKADKEAVALLGARRIFDAAVEKYLEDLLEEAAKIAPTPELVPTDDRSTDEAAIALHAWLVDWRGQARVVIARGDYLIRLGVASRRSSDPEEDDGEAIDAEDEAAPENAPLSVAS
jgi:hypothetical protein